MQIYSYELCQTLSKADMESAKEHTNIYPVILPKTGSHHPQFKNVHKLMIRFHLFARKILLDYFKNTG